jgi:hypothetical protein
MEMCFHRVHTFGLHGVALSLGSLRFRDPGWSCLPGLNDRKEVYLRSFLGPRWHPDFKFLGQLELR